MVYHSIPVNKLESPKVSQIRFIRQTTVLLSKRGREELLLLWILLWRMKWNMPGLCGQFFHPYGEACFVV
jgi:hypothetical protein